MTNKEILFHIYDNSVVVEIQKIELDQSDVDTIRTRVLDNGLKTETLLLECPFATSITQEGMQSLAKLIQDFSQVSIRFVIMAAPPLSDEMAASEIGKLAKGIIDLHYHRLTSEKRENLSDFMIATLPSCLGQMLSSLGCQTQLLNHGINYNPHLPASVFTAARVSIIAKNCFATVYIACEIPCYIKLCNEIVGETYTRIDEQNRDWIKEFANMIGNLLCEKMRSQGTNAQIDLPMDLDIKRVKELFARPNTEFIICDLGLGKMIMSVI